MPQSPPIPVRFEDDTLQMIDSLSERTGMARSDIIRRCVAYTLKLIRETGDLGLLLEDPRLKSTLEESSPTFGASTLARSLDEINKRLQRLEERRK